MKLSWLWIIGIFLAILFFLSKDNKNLSANTSTFKGYSCTVDCSGHEAGYKWAKKKGLINPDDCHGNSNSFIEGCQAYTAE